MPEPRPGPIAALCAALALTACPARVPSALRLDPPPTPAEAAEAGPVADRDSLIAAVIHGDPLARTPRLPPLTEVPPGGEALVDALTRLGELERLSERAADDAPLLAARAQGTEVPAVLRGYRLGIAEQLLAAWQGDPTRPELLPLATLLTELAPPEEGAAVARHPLLALTGAAPFAGALLAWAERWALWGWVEAPGAPLSAVAAALDQPQFDDLRRTAPAQLIEARAAGRRDTVRGDIAAAALARATSLALEEAAADRDREQGAWADRRAEVAEALGARDPIGTLLATAADAALDDATTPRSAGVFVVASQALRLRGTCARPPCGGPDRVASLAAAAAWDPEVAGWSSTWRAIALKRAVDGYTVGHDTVRFPVALLDLTDALLGTGAAPPPVTLLTRRTEDAEVLRALATAVGGDATTLDDLLVPLGAHLARVAAEARATAPEASRALLDRIAARAVP